LLPARIAYAAGAMPLMHERHYAFAAAAACAAALTHARVPLR